MADELKSTLVYRNFWTQRRVNKLTAEQKGLLLFLLTNTSFNYTGIYQVYSGDIRSRYDGDLGSIFDKTPKPSPCEFLFKKYPEEMEEKSKDPYLLQVYQKLNDLCESGNIEFEPDSHTVRIVNIRDFVFISKGIKGFSGNGILVLDEFNQIMEKCQVPEFFDKFITENDKFLYDVFVKPAIKCFEKSNGKSTNPYNLKIVNRVLEIVKPKSTTKPIESTVVKDNNAKQKSRY